MGRVKSNVILRPSTISLHNSSLRRQKGKAAVGSTLNFNALATSSGQDLKLHFEFYRSNAKAEGIYVKLSNQYQGCNSIVYDLIIHT